jgi:formyl-CoA transferase
VIVRVSGWGQDGPYRDRPGFGSLVEGMSGFAAKNGYPDRPPVLPPLALADMIAGLYGASAVMVALREVEVNGGAGQVIDLPLLDPLVSILGPEAAVFKLTGKVTPRSGSRSATSSPRNVFETKDGKWISISASIQAMAERVFRAIGRPDMIDDPRFRTNADRVRNAEACEAPLRDFIRERNLAEALAVFEQAEVTAAPVYDIEQFLADPHVKAREIVLELPDAEIGSVAMHAVVPRLAATPGAIRAAAPALGEHTGEILRGLGLEEAEIAALRENKVI